MEGWGASFFDVHRLLAINHGENRLVLVSISVGLIWYSVLDLNALITVNQMKVENLIKGKSKRGINLRPIECVHWSSSLK